MWTVESGGYTRSVSMLPDLKEIERRLHRYAVLHEALRCSNRACDLRPTLSGDNLKGQNAKEGRQDRQDKHDPVKSPLYLSCTSFFGV